MRRDQGIGTFGTIPKSCRQTLYFNKKYTNTYFILLVVSQYLKNTEDAPLSSQISSNGPRSKGKLF